MLQSITTHVEWHDTIQLYIAVIIEVYLWMWVETLRLKIKFRKAAMSETVKDTCKYSPICDSQLCTEEEVKRESVKLVNVSM